MPSKKPRPTMPFAEQRSLKFRHKFLEDFREELDDPAFLDGIIERILLKVENMAESQPGQTVFSEILDFSSEEVQRAAQGAAPPDAEKFIRAARADLQLTYSRLRTLEVIPTIKAFLPGFYAWEADQAGKHFDKQKILMQAEYRQSLMLWYLVQYQSSCVNLLYDLAYFMSIHGQGEFGHRPMEIIDRLWQEHKPSLRTGPLPKTKAASQAEYRAFMRQILTILNPAFKSTGEAPKFAVKKKHRAILDAVKIVNNHVHGLDRLDESDFYGNHAASRSAKRIAIHLTAHRFAVSEATVRRALNG
jgi:hypothetical protein